GLGCAHSQGLVHRDVKPSNIFLAINGQDQGGDSQPVVKVLDFGLAVFAHGEGARVTRTGEIVGTPGFMSPEQAQGVRAPDARSDVFSLCAVLYTAVAGIPPFGDDGAIAVVVRMLTEAPRPLNQVRRDVPAALSDLLTRGLAREPEDRPQTMEALIRALDELTPELSNELPAIALADTDQVYYERASLDDEQRVVTAMLANGVSDVHSVVGAIRQHGGTAAIIGAGQVVGLFGTQESEGDEADRAVSAALQIESLAAVIGIGTGRAVQERGRLAEEAVQTAENATATLDSGVLLDAQTRARIGDRWLTDGLRVVARSDEPETAQPHLPFVGRSGDVADLRGRMERAFEDEEVGGVLLLGAPGVGKSRLVSEVLAGVAAEVRILSGRGESNRRYTAWHAIAVALRFGLKLTVHATPAEISRACSEAAAEAGLDDIAALFLAATLGVPLPPGVSPATDTARRDPTVMRDQIVTVIGDLIEGWAEEQPVLLALEDVQWADSSSLELVQIALERAQQSPLFVVMTGRPYALEERAELLQSPSLDRRQVRELSRKASSTLAAAAFGELEPGERVIKAIADHSAGNPFFVQEIVAHVATRLRAHGAEGFDSAIFTLPLTVEAAVQARLDHLPSTDKDLLKRASVFGERFWREALEAFGGPDSGQSLQRLWQSGFVVRPRRREQWLPTCEEYTFKHRVVREVAYGMLTGQQRQMLHLAAGRWLSERPDAPAPEAAQHLDLGGDRVGARQLWQRAAEQARTDGDLSAVLFALEQALDSGEDAREMAGLRLEQARAAAESGRYDVAEQALAALPQDGGSHDLATELLLLGRVVRVRGDGSREERNRAAFSLFDQARQRFAGGQDPDGESRALASLATTERYSGLGDGIEWAQRAVKVAGTDPARRAYALAALGLLQLHDADLLGALRTHEQALDAARSAGDLSHVVSLLGDLAYVQLSLGAFDQAVDGLREVIDRARKLGAVAVAGYAWHNLGLALLRADAAEEALAAEDRALEMAAEAGNTSLAAYCQTYRALILLDLGRLDDAERAAKSALLAHASSSDEPAARTALAMIHRAAGRADEALSEADLAYQKRVESGGMLEFELDLLWVRANLLIDGDRAVEGEALLDEARHILMQKADALSAEPALQARFLDGAVHRAIRRLAGGVS
ncbi:MAG: tetratricopeptide (TPR) repeat protein, partial [Myxococcota bacterium]